MDQQAFSQKGSNRILVVDDEEDITTVLSDVLTEHGYETDTALGGEEGLALFKDKPYDLVITDLKMPGMSGLELLRHVRGFEPTSTVIIMTGFATVETAVEALKSGAYDYILKPFKVGELLKIVERAYDKIRLSSENLQLKEQLMLLKLSEAVASSLSVDEVLKLVVDAARAEVGADCVEVLFRPPGSEGFTQHLAKSTMGDMPSMIARSERLDEIFAGRAPRHIQGEQLAELLTPEAGAVIRRMVSVPLFRGDNLLGVINAYSSNAQRGFLPREEKALFVLGDRAAASVENALLYAEMESTFRETIQGLALALETKDAYTHGHSESVTSLADATAEAMGMNGEFRSTLRQAGILHDIGKIGISSAILNKPGRLDPSEYEIIKSHPRMGARILEKISFLRDVVPLVYHHHERWDGLGYPMGLSGEDIPVGARVMQVADTYDAMTSDRSYREGLPHEEAVAELKRCSGTQFDPACVEGFLKTEFGNTGKR